MRQTEGERNFIAPPLKTAPVFGGIAGIIAGDQAEGDDGSHMPSMSSKAQESGKLQDMYRQNLAASWAAQAGELPPDKCVEDIFAGGDGWGDQSANGPRGDVASTAESSDADARSVREHQRHASGSTLKPQRHHAQHNSGPSAVSGRTSIQQQIHASGGVDRHIPRRNNEIYEFAEREDLRSWEISTPS